MNSNRWSDDAFLDTMAGLGDEEADDCFGKIKEELAKEDFASLFDSMNSNAEPLPTDMPPVLGDFFDNAIRLPRMDGQDVDMAQIKRGENVFMTHAFPAALVLLVKSLPEGYSAPRLSRVLAISGNLRDRPYRRLLGVLQMLINVTSVGSFESKGLAIVTAVKMRMLHAGIRDLVPKYVEDFDEECRGNRPDGWVGTPVSLEDMLGTIMGFSLLVIQGLQHLRIGLTDAQAEDLYYPWRVFAQAAGIYPPGEPDSTEYVPATVADAATFYKSYARRHYVEASRNGWGVVLAKANIQMVNDLLPQTPLRRLGLKIVPRIYMQDLCGDEGCRRVGIKPVPLLFLTKLVLIHMPAVWVWVWERLDGLDRSNSVHERLSRWFFQRLITKGRDGKVQFLIPDDLADLRKLT